MNWVQDPNQNNVHNINNTRGDARRNFRGEKAKTEEHELTVR